MSSMMLAWGGGEDISQAAAKHTETVMDRRAEYTVGEDGMTGEGVSSRGHGKRVVSAGDKLSGEAR